MLLAGTTDAQRAGLEHDKVVTSAATKEVRPPVYRSEELLRGCREAWIEHGEQMYRLRLTAAGKLYLTK
jgi:hemin uptake protein HemP